MTTETGSPHPRLTGSIALNPKWLPLLFSDQTRQQLDDSIELVPLPFSVDRAGGPAFRDVDVLITGWGCPPIGTAELDQMPSLKAIFHAAGTVKGHLDREVWNRNILVTTAAQANAKPVAEFTLAMILLAGKQTAKLGRGYTRGDDIDLASVRGLGNNGKKIGIVGASRVGRDVITLLSAFDFEIYVYDPFAAADSFGSGVRVRMSTLDEIFSECDVVSLHAPLIEQTIGMIDRQLLTLLQPGATLINTGRGALVVEPDLIAAVASQDITAILDVTVDEPLPSDHPFRTATNVVLTPHLAGAQGNELLRLGEAAVEELARFLDGRAPLFPVSASSLDHIA